MNNRFACMVILPVLISLSHFVNAAKPVSNLPSQFSDEEFGPIYMNGAYGCSNMRPIYYLTIDFEAKTYTRIEKGCSAGDWSYSARRGNIEWVEGKAIKTLKERGYGNDKDSIKWRNIDHALDGYFKIYSTDDGIGVYEFFKSGDSMSWSK